jgi:hypothetical protein
VRFRARQLAQKLGSSENRLYSDLIQEGLLVREQVACLEKLRTMQVSAQEGLALLDLTPDVPPAKEGALPRRRRAGRS